MYYEININKLKTSNHYAHYFATAKRSITNKVDAALMLRNLEDKFPMPEYRITISKHHETIYSCSAEKFLENPDYLD